MIKQVKEKNLAECANVIKESFLTIANDFGFTIENAPAFTAFATTEDKLKYQLHHEQRLMFAFFDNDSIVGFYSLHLQENNEWELSNLCVLPSYRHKGIGEKLLEHAFSVTQEKHCTKIIIGIVGENKRLKKWYESFGFTHIGTQKFDFFPFTCGYMEKTIYK